MGIVKNIEEIEREIEGKGVTLVVVSKTRSHAEIMEAYDGGARIFGENRPRELEGKYKALPKDIRWHFIGSLQTNKVKYIAPFVTLIHSVDSDRLLESIQKEGVKNGRILDVLLELHVAQEDTKHGWDTDSLERYLQTSPMSDMPNVRIRGVMAMATLTDDMQLVRNEFRIVKNAFEHLKRLYFNDNPAFDTLSMGMSNDYSVAVEEGSSMIRVGSRIFK